MSAAEIHTHPRELQAKRIYLYTHETVTENLALYSRIGYVDYDRRRHRRGLPRLPGQEAWCFA
jgi:hypothetical protein